MEFKTNFKQIDLKDLEHLRFKKYFEIQDLEQLLPDCKLFIIKGKKNIGKTYSILEKMKQLHKNNERFLYLRVSDSEVKSLASEWNTNPEIEFFIKGNRIYNKENLKEGVGMISDIKNTQKLRSLQFHGYTHIFFDEFVPYKPIKDPLETARNIVRLMIDVQRDKPDLKMYCFGNNEAPDDIFTNYFKIDFTHPFWYDSEAKVMVCNFKDFYTGANKGVGTGLSYYDDILRDYLENNVPIIDTSLITPYIYNDCIVHHSIVYNNNYYLFLQEKEIDKNKILKLKNKYQIASCDYKKANQYKMIAFNIPDSVLNKNAILLQEQQTQAYLQKWYNAIKHHIITFSDSLGLQEIPRLLTLYLKIKK